MTQSSLFLTATIGLSVVLPPLASAACPSGMVESGSTCMDKYEASVWKITNTNCISLIKQGANLPQSCINPALQIAIDGTSFPPPCDQNTGANCTNIFALSLQNVTPAYQINYFTAAAACRNSGKRLPTNAEWQAAALGPRILGL
jgi:hypothetical protein